MRCARDRAACRTRSAGTSYRDPTARCTGPSAHRASRAAQARRMSSSEAIRSWAPELDACSSASLQVARGPRPSDRVRARRWPGRAAPWRGLGPRARRGRALRAARRRRRSDRRRVASASPSLRLKMRTARIGIVELAAEDLAPRELEPAVQPQRPRPTRRRARAPARRPARAGGAPRTRLARGSVWSARTSRGGRCARRCAAARDVELAAHGGGDRRAGDLAHERVRVAEALGRCAR